MTILPYFIALLFLCVPATWLWLWVALGLEGLAKVRIDGLDEKITAWLAVKTMPNREVVLYPILKNYRWVEARAEVTLSQDSAFWVEIDYRDNQ